MSENLTLNQTESQNDLEFGKVDHLEPDHSAINSSITGNVMRFYASVATSMKDKIDNLGAEVSMRHDQMRLINEIIAEINDLTDEKNSFQISTEKTPELIKKLQVAKELGVKVKDGQFKFNAIERDRLLENLHISLENWDKQNRFQTQKMEIHVKELDRLMLLLKDVERKEDQAKRSMLAGIKG